MCKVAAEEWFNSNLELDVNPRELALYLAMVYERDFLVSLGPWASGSALSPGTWLKRNGPKPGIPTPKILTRTLDTASKFVTPRRFQTDKERRMITKLAWLVQSVTNSISAWSQVTIDCHSQHHEEQGFMPILDVQAKIVNKKKT